MNIQTPVPVQSEPDPLIGRVLGGLYEVVGRIGEGGMGAVYEARHVHLDKMFAVKVLHARRADHPTALDRFVAEARAASHIDHPHIVQVVNLDLDEEGRIFIVMERLHGRSLDDLMAEGPLPCRRAVDIAIQICDALQSAHDQGIIHRDLKPENVFLCEGHTGDYVKVLDFGVSKFKDTGSNVRLTATDQIVGTPLYLSPEQARGDADLDHRADIYALAAMLYEMISGTTPFSGDNHFQLLWKHGSQLPDPLRERCKEESVPAALEAAIMRGLEKQPSARFASMREFASALRTEPAEAAPKISRPSAANKRWGWLTVVALGSLVLGGWWMLSSPQAEPAIGAKTPPANVIPAPKPEPAPSADPSLDPGATSPIAAASHEVRLALRSTPDGALVRIDGKVAGTTPMELLTRRDARPWVTFSRKGYRTVRRKLDPTGEPTVHVVLRRRRPLSPGGIKTDF